MSVKEESVKHAEKSQVLHNSQPSPVIRETKTMELLSVISPLEISGPERDDTSATIPSHPVNADQTLSRSAVSYMETSHNPNAASSGEEIENPSRPKGIRFAILFLSILAGDSFVGYVRFTFPFHLRQSLRLI